MNLKQLGKLARQASKVLAAAPTRQKNDCLHIIATVLRERSNEILQENAVDLEVGRDGKMSPSMLDRLELTVAGVNSMADSLVHIARLPDPVGQLSDLRRQPSGIEVGRMRTP